MWRVDIRALQASTQGTVTFNAYIQHLSPLHENHELGENRLHPTVTIHTSRFLGHTNESYAELQVLRAGPRFWRQKDTSDTSINRHMPAKYSKVLLDPTTCGNFR